MGVPGWGAAVAYGLKLFNRIAGIWGKKEEANERAGERDRGGELQRGVSNEAELETLRDDRVRDGNDALSERVRRDRGIQADGEP